MISGNQSTNSSNFPYQRCLIPNLAADLQLQMRDISNYIVVPFDTLLGVMSLVCNALVFVTITRTKSLRHPSLLMLCSLSISDLIWALFTVVRNSLTFLHPYMCLEESREKECFSILCYLATLSNLAMISRDRYLAMSRPLWYRNHVRRSSTRVVDQGNVLKLAFMRSYYSGSVRSLQNSYQCQSYFCYYIPLLCGLYCDDFSQLHRTFYGK